MTEPTRIVMGMLPAEFESKDAPAIIQLAAAASVAMAAVGNRDMAMLDKVLVYAADTVQAMPQASQETLFAVVNELADCLLHGKRLFVLGGFKPQDPKQ